MSRTAINPQLLKSEIELWKAKCRMHEALIEAAEMKGTLERDVIGQAAPMLGLQSHSVLMRHYLEAHKAFDTANLDILRLQLAELKSSLAIREAMLREAEQSVVIPSRIHL